MCIFVWIFCHFMRSWVDWGAKIVKVERTKWNVMCTNPLTYTPIWVFFINMMTVLRMCRIVYEFYSHCMVECKILTHFQVDFFRRHSKQIEMNENDLQKMFNKSKSDSFQWSKRRTQIWTKLLIHIADTRCSPKMWKYNQYNNNLISFFFLLLCVTLILVDQMWHPKML